MGTLLRLAIIMLAVWIVVRFVKKLASSDKKKISKPVDSGSMIPCAYCGVYVPKAEALIHEQRYYCCQKHLDANK